MSPSIHARLLCGFTRLHGARGLAISACLILLLTGCCAEAMADRPSAVDHSTEMYFPPIGRQMYGDCTCFSSCYYYNTYLHARDEGLDALVALIKTFFAKGGYALQFNVFDVEALRDAQKHPERYASLQIRVTGWSVYFTTLSKEEQDLFIVRNTHGA